MLLAAVVEVSREVGATRSRRDKTAAIASLLTTADPGEAAAVVAYLSGVLPGGRAGIGWRSLQDKVPPAVTSSLTVTEVDASITELTAATGAGSRARRRALLDALFGRATEAEQKFLSALLLGDLRHGALAGIMTGAVATATGIPLAEVRRAAMFAGDLGAVAGAALSGGRAALEQFRPTLMKPLQPMLAQSAADVAAALQKAGGASAIEWKLDGARVQIHVRSQEVRAYTRNLADVTDRLPEVTEVVGALPLTSAIFDGEVIALRDDGRPHPFQTTMSRFGSSRGAGALRAEVPLSVFLFDCLQLDGTDLIDRPAHERIDALAGRVPADLLVPRLVTDDPAAGEEFLEAALARGHEGVMVKALGAPYEAGRRGAAWIKVKRAHTLDLVVLAAEWGHGRRQGRLSNLHLGARDPETSGFVMLGKTFKGMTDEMLAWQTERLLSLESARRGITVEVRPELVVEVAFDGLQRSSRYPAGLALRFARIKGYRLDKGPDEADTIETVRGLQTDG